MSAGEKRQPLKWRLIGQGEGNSPLIGGPDIADGEEIDVVAEGRNITAKYHGRDVERIADLEVERAALILRLKEREHYAAWAIELADTAESFVYGQCSEGGLLETIARFRSAQIGERP